MAACEFAATTINAVPVHMPQAQARGRTLWTGLFVYMENSLDKLTQLGSEAVQSAIAQYTTWHIWSAIGFVVFGIVLCAIAVVVWKRANKNEDVDAQMLFCGIAIAVFIFGILFVLCNVPTLIAPRAYAIHQLLIDAVPHGR